MGCENEKCGGDHPPQKKNALEEPVSVTEIETIPKSKAFHIQSSAKFGPWKPQKERNRFTGTAYAARASPFTNSFKMCRRKQLKLHDRKYSKRLLTGKTAALIRVSDHRYRYLQKRGEYPAWHQMPCTTPPIVPMPHVHGGPSVQCTYPPVIKHQNMGMENPKFMGDFPIYKSPFLSGSFPPPFIPVPPKSLPPSRTHWSPGRTVSSKSQPQKLAPKRCSP